MTGRVPPERVAENLRRLARMMADKGPGPFRIAGEEPDPEKFAEDQRTLLETADAYDQIGQQEPQ